MRIVVVGMSGSVHIARYLQLLDGSGWDVHLFETHLAADPHPDIPTEVTLHPPRPWTSLDGSGPRVAAPPAGAGDSLAARAAHLGEVVAAVQPHVIHSHGIIHGGETVDELRRRDGRLPAPWLVTNWGSDILRFGRDATYVPRIRSVLGACDGYGSECHRDVALARAFGFRGRVVGVWPVTGGIDLAHTARLRAPGPPSARRAIAFKGVEQMFGRARVGLAALARCRDLLAGWELCGYQMDTEVDERAAALAENAGMRYTRLSQADARQSPHDAVLAMHGRARVAIGLNTTDGLSTSFLEAMTMGAFPVQGTGSCAYEITPPGRGALFVDPEDEEAVIAALRRALTDDALVDEADGINARAAAEHLDRRRTRARVLDVYERLAADALLAEVA